MKARINFQFILLLLIGVTAASAVTAAVFSNVFRIGRAEILQAIPSVLLCVFIISVLLVGIGFFYTKRIVRPIEKLSENLKNGSVDFDNPEVKYEELADLMETIRNQHQGIVDNADMRQQFTANVTHELKTPLTAITGYSELIENGMASGEDVRRFAREIRKNSLRLLTLINDTIRLSELDLVGEDDECELVDLYEVADTCVNMLQFNAESNDIHLELEGHSVMVMANRVMMEELVYNLIDNAIRYNKKFGNVQVSLQDDNNSVFLSVKDTGIGISKEHQNRIFERFYRVDKSRSRKKGGTGLGLAIVKHIVAIHNAEIFVASEEGRGTEIMVIFKKA